MPQKHVTVYGNQAFFAPTNVWPTRLMHIVISLSVHQWDVPSQMVCFKWSQQTQTQHMKEV